MSSFGDFIGVSWLNSQIKVADIPILKVILVIVVITLAQIFRKLFSAIIIGYLEKLTSQTETELDDELIAILKQPLNFLIVITGVWAAKLIIVTELDPAINHTFDRLISLVAIATGAWIIFRASPLLGKLLAHLALEIDTELDDLIVPYLPKLFQTLAVAILPSAKELEKSLGDRELVISD